MAGVNTSAFIEDVVIDLNNEIERFIGYPLARRYYVPPQDRPRAEEVAWITGTEMPLDQMDAIDLGEPEIPWQDVAGATAYFSVGLHGDKLVVEKRLAVSVMGSEDPALIYTDSLVLPARPYLVAYGIDVEGAGPKFSRAVKAWLEAPMEKDGT